ncbi:MAG: DUF5119 domain-containing protein [Prevotella sp.]|nr:DUF5119 domain-containing protein [Prevotella sp.]
MKRYSYLLLFVSSICLTSCSADLRELCYDHNHTEDYSAILKLDLKLDIDIDIDVDVDVDVETHTKIEMPQYMKVCCYSPQTGAIQNTEFVSGTGGPIHTSPGVYQMVVYEFGTEYTQIRGEGDINTLEAITSDITATKALAFSHFTRAQESEPSGPIIYTPDHLLVANEQVEIPAFSADRHTVTLTAVARTIVETYSFEVKTVVGVEYIESCEAFVTNQARSSFFGQGTVNPQPATISFPVGVDRANKRLITAFNTFGKLPGESHSYLHILIRDTGGEEHYITEDITDQFEKPDHKIIIEEPVEIPKPEGGGGGGIAPSVDPWEDVNHDVPIG